MKKTVIVSMVLLLGCRGVGYEPFEMPPYEMLRRQALAESRIPVKPGIPGETPFWNAYAHRFIYAPAFDFPETDSAGDYRFTLLADSLAEPLVFTADKPWKPLSPVWDQVPTGNVNLTVEAMKNGRAIGISGERRFYRASPYAGPYHHDSTGYRESAERLFRSLFHAPYIRYWMEHGEPDPGYGLYGYPAKMYSAVIGGMITFASLTEDPGEKEQALGIAAIVADKLIAISRPEGAPLEYFPPTYLGPIYADMVDEWRGESLADRMMLIYPAVAGQAYLDLFEVNGERKYLDAAVRIAESYRKTQLESGTWHLLVYLETGDPVSGNLVVPTGVISFLERLSSVTGCSGCAMVADRARSWIGDHLARDFNWEGQFEDQAPSDRYRNLSKGQACSYALLLLEETENEPLKVREAEELIRFAEDQFVIWEDPVQGDYWGIRSEQWITPCVLEQYNFYTPVNASSADMIGVFRKAYQVTGNALYLAKAMDLANCILHVQDPESGHYPTYLVSNLLDQEGWINCMVYTARTILELSETCNPAR